MLIRYSSNNSGGSWWLTDDDWRKLEAAGWKVEWYKVGDMMVSQPAPDGYPRFLGALAGSATVERDSIEAAIREFEEITGQDANAQGCSCCGQPHYFSEW